MPTVTIHGRKFTLPTPPPPKPLACQNCGGRVGPKGQILTTMVLHSGNVVSALCGRCVAKAKREDAKNTGLYCTHCSKPHGVLDYCPYRSEINGDDSKCTCCPTCRDICADEI